MCNEIEAALEAGETLMVTRNGIVIGELRGVGRHASVPRETVLAAFSRAPAVNFRPFRADIDAVVDQDPTPRS